MKTIVLVSMLLLTHAFAQHILILNNGTEHPGRFIDNKNNIIYFIPDDTVNNKWQRLPEFVVHSVIDTEGGVFFINDKISSNEKAGDIPKKENTLEIRQTVALEKIAQSQTYFMYYSIIITVLTILVIL